jgi:hypothetical protein
VNPKTYPNWHGSPYDRGCADAWYGRAPSPHKYPNGTYKGERVTLTDPEELEAYTAGYEETYADPTMRKDWG